MTKRIYIKRPDRKNFVRIDCEDYNISGNYLTIIEHNGDRTIHNIAFIKEISIPKNEE